MTPTVRRRLVVAAALVVAVLWVVFAGAFLGHGHDETAMPWSAQITRAGAPEDIVQVDGVTVELIEGSLALWEVTAIECPHEHGWAPFRAVFGSSVAAAGHGDGTPTRLRGPFVLDLVEPERVTLGMATAREPEHCEFHAAFAASSGSERLAGTAAPTLRLVIDVRDGNGTSRREIVTTNAAGGPTVDVGEAYATEWGVTVVVDVGSILQAVASGVADGVTTDDELAQAALDALDPNYVSEGGGR